jgi:thiol-disulfide isomerase/thioredoxin
MEKWKGVVIVLIIAAIGIYSFAASRPPAPTATPDKPPASAQDLQKLVGQPAPDFGIPASLWDNTDGKNPVTVASLKGHVTILEFWRATCPHCHDAAPFMESLYKKYGKDGLRMVGIQSPSDNPDPHFAENDWSQVRAVVDQWGITYPIGFDEHAVLFKSKYSGTLYPTILVLDKNGVVRYAETGYDDDKSKRLEQTVQQMLKTGNVQPAATHNEKNPGVK